MAKRKLKMTSVTGKQSRGFSLFELIITLMLIGIFTSLFLYHYSQSEINVAEKFKADLGILILRTVRVANTQSSDEALIFATKEIRQGSERLLIPEGLSISMKRSNENSFRKPEKNEEWIFSGNQLIEPIEFILTDPNGKLTFTVDPLTGYLTDS